MKEKESNMSVSEPQLSARVSCAVSYLAGQEADLYFLSEDGRKVPAHRSLLMMQSELLHSLLRDHPAYLMAPIIVPGAQYSSLCSLVSLLYTGKCVPGDDLLNINSLARQILMIDLNITEVSAQHSSDESEGEIVDENLVDPLSVDFPEQVDNVKPGPKSFKRKLEASGSRQSPKSKEGKLFTCQICQQTGFSSVAEFQGHLSEEHFLKELTVSYGGRNKSCRLCGSKFLTDFKMARHIGVQHDKVMEMYPKRVAKLTDRIVGKYGVNEVQCSLCQIKFRNKQLLGSHIGAVHKKLDEFLHEDLQPELEIQIQ